MSVSNSGIDSLLVDFASRQLGLGGKGNNTYSVFSGINALGGIPALPQNVDNQGMVFFTKPCLNLSQDNVSGVRKLAYLLDNGAYSMANVIRCMLNPPIALINRLGNAGLQNNDTTRSQIIDDQCAFLPISNLLLTLSAPPDLAADTYTTDEGVLHEQVGNIDGGAGILHAYDLTATFANMEGDPITTIFSSWIEYAQRVQRGEMMPWPINILARRIDYNTRIYRLILDRSRTYVQNIYACGAAFPYTVPLGAKHGYTHGQHLSPESDQIQINFKCFGAMYDDPILISEFNKVVGIFNSDMDTTHQKTMSSNMVKVKGVSQSGVNLLALLNYKLYPRINPDTMELEWYATSKNYNLVLELLKEVEYPNTTIVSPDLAISQPWAGINTDPKWVKQNVPGPL